MSIDTKQLMNSLSPANRKQVEKVVMRFANTHPEAGILPLELEQVYRDVIEAVKLQAHFPAHQLPEVRSWEQAQHYAQFVTPQFEY